MKRRVGVDAVRRSCLPERRLVACMCTLFGPRLFDQKATVLLVFFFALGSITSRSESSATRCSRS
jgi:hypothetical protein